MSSYMCEVDFIEACFRLGTENGVTIPYQFGAKYVISPLLNSLTRVFSRTLCLAWWPPHVAPTPSSSSSMFFNVSACTYIGLPK